MQWEEIKERCGPLKLPLTYLKSLKKWFWGRRFVGGWETLDLGHAYSNRTHFRACFA